MKGLTEIEIIALLLIYEARRHLANVIKTQTFDLLVLWNCEL